MRCHEGIRRLVLPDWLPRRLLDAMDDPAPDWQAYCDAADARTSPPPPEPPPMPDPRTLVVTLPGPVYEIPVEAIAAHRIAYLVSKGIDEPSARGEVEAEFGSEAEILYWAQIRMKRSDVDDAAVKVREAEADPDLAWTAAQMYVGE
jgi:hypothetical protein